MSSLTYIGLLRGRRSFRRLWSGQVVSELGNWFNFIAVLGLVRVVTHAAPEATAIIVVLRLAPFAVCAPIAGALADRWPRRTVMIVTDLARCVFALGFLFVRRPEDVWIAYVCMTAIVMLSAFFDAAKNAAMPNLAGDDGLLAGNALMYSSRFLLMAVGSALGGFTTDWLGYKAAFIINAASFIVSAYTVWLIPAREMRADDAATTEASERRAAQDTVWRRIAGIGAEMRDGWRYIFKRRIITTIISINILWAIGGGACNLLYERLGAVVFAGNGGLQANSSVAFIFTAVGSGLFIGMMLAQRVGARVERRKATVRFIGWMVILHGVLFALAGLMPTLALASLMIFLSRVVIGVEFAVQDTLLMRLLPDDFRGRVLTTDRASEFMMMSFSSMLGGWLLVWWMTPRTLTLLAGLFCALPGALWLALFASGKVKLPQRYHGTPESLDAEREAAFVTVN